MRYWLGSIVRALFAQARAEARRASGAIADARDEVIERLAEFSALAHLDGFRRVITMANMDPRERLVAARRPVEPRIPPVPFDEAVDELAARMPRLARTADAVADLYRDPDGPFFALVAAPTRTVASKVQDVVARGIAQGEELSAGDVVGEMTDWGQSYGRMVVRTNATGAEARGRRQQAARMADTFPALIFETAGDASVRNGINSPENHAAMDGFVAVVSWPGWRQWTPPLGYNCRCTVRLVPVEELQQMGLWTPGRGVDPRIVNPTVPAAARKHAGF